MLKDDEILKLIEEGYEEFQNLADELSDAKKDRVKVQYYTGSKFMKEKYNKRANEFQEDIVKPYIEKIRKEIGKIERKYQKLIEGHFFEEKDLGKKDPLIQEIKKNTSLCSFSKLC